MNSVLLAVELWQRYALPVDQEVASCRRSNLAERVLECLRWRLLHRVHRAEEKRQKLLLPGLDGIRKAGIVTNGPGVL